MNRQLLSDTVTMILNEINTLTPTDWWHYINFTKEKLVNERRGYGQGVYDIIAGNADIAREKERAGAETCSTYCCEPTWVTRRWCCRLVT